MLQITLKTALCLQCILLSFAGYSAESVVSSIREVLIIENNDPIIDLRNQIAIAYDPKFLLTNPDCTKMRKAVYEKLCEAQKLLPKGLFFKVNVALRSLNVQARMFNEMKEEIQKKFPDMTEKELFLETSKFVAPVKTWEGIINVPPHSTGGAIDLILAKEDGSYLDLGLDCDSNDEDVIATDSPFISLEARKNRAIMGKALSEVGFVNYPGEFWHWSYGDRRWAFITKAPHSFYGPIAED
jgi:zinc D-Ala-D-Ala dipeptidase